MFIMFSSISGEILMQGRNVMMGYLNQPDKTDEAITKSGWLRSGDLGTVDDAGFFKITGRAKEILITAGMYINGNMGCGDFKRGVKT